MTKITFLSRASSVGQCCAVIRKPVDINKPRSETAKLQAEMTINVTCMRCPCHKKTKLVFEFESSSIWVLVNERYPACSSHILIDSLRLLLHTGRSKWMNGFMVWKPKKRRTYQNSLFPFRSCFTLPSVLSSFSFSPFFPVQSVILISSNKQEWTLVVSTLGPCRPYHVLSGTLKLCQDKSDLVTRRLFSNERK